MIPPEDVAVNFTHASVPVLYRCKGPARNRQGYRIEAYKILKATACGVWIELNHSRERKFVNLQARKQFASLTVGYAVEQWSRRANRRKVILESQLEELRSMRQKHHCLSVGLETRDRYPKDRPEWNMEAFSGQ